MARRAGMSQVKFKVRHNALLLREFTVADIVRATGLNPESVRTELQRMRQEGFLTSQPHPDRHRKRGGHPALYQLTEDSEVRLALSESIEAFYPPAPASNRPTSRHYLLAQHTLNQALNEYQPQQRKCLLDQVELDLEMAEQAEGGSLASQSARAYIEYERARLAYLRGRYEEAQSSLEELSAFFTGINDDTMVRHTKELLVCLRARARFVEESSYGGVGEDSLSRCLLQALDENAYETDSLLISLLIQQLRGLTRPAIDMILTDVVNQAIEAGRRAISETVRQEFAAQTMYSTYEVLTLRQGEQPPLSGGAEKGRLPYARREDQEFEERVRRQFLRPDRARTHG